MPQLLVAVVMSVVINVIAGVALDRQSMREFLFAVIALAAVLAAIGLIIT